MPGEMDLQRILETIAVDRRPGLSCFLTGATELAAYAEATVQEQEGLTVVVPVDVAREHGFEPDLEMAWLTLRVHSSLEAAGLTAAVSQVLADVGISCNVIAGYHHDHLLVPAARADAAIAAIESLSTTAG